MTRFTTRIATQDDTKKIQRLLDQIYAKTFGVQVLPASSHVVTFLKGEAVATIGFEFCTEGKLPIEKFFTIEDAAYLKMPRCAIAEFTRWASLHPLAGAYAVLEAAHYMWQLDRKHIIFSIKEHQLRYFSHVQLPLSILGARIVAKIPKPLQAYYLAEPPPLVVTAKTEEIRNAFGTYLTNIKK